MDATPEEVPEVKLNLKPLKEGSTLFILAIGFSAIAAGLVAWLFF